MRIVVLGAGAIGSVVGGRLALGGCAVTLVDTDPDRVEAVNRDGLRLDLDGGPAVVRLRACLPADAAPPCDLVLLATKTFQTADALAGVRPLLADAFVLSLQNGLGNAERIAAFVPIERVIVGTSLIPADFRGPGHVASHGSGVTALYCTDGTHRPILDAIAAAFAAAELPMVLEPDIRRAIWEKAAFNAAMNALCGLTRATPGIVGASPEALALAKAVAAEACVVAAANGVAADVAAVAGRIDGACRDHAGHKPSMLQDLLAGRRTEVDALNGAVVAAAEQAGVEAPLSAMLCRLVKLAEAAAARG